MTGQDYYKSDKSTAQLRREYSKAAYTARRRYKALEEKYPQSETVAIHRGDFKPLSDLGKMGRREIANELAATKRFLFSDSSKVKGYAKTRNATVESFHAHGYDFVNEKNLDAVQSFMAMARSKGIISAATSSYILKAAERAARRKMTEKEFMANVDYWASGKYTGSKYHFRKNVDIEWSSSLDTGSDIPF